MSPTRNRWGILCDAARTLSVGCLVAGLAVAFLENSAKAASAPVALRVTGSNLLLDLASKWQRELSSGDGMVRIDYNTLNSAAGRKALLEGNTDIASSPLDFDSSELAEIEDLKVAGKKPSFVIVPVGASSLQFAELPPNIRLVPFDATANLPVSDIQRSPNGYSAGQILSWTLADRASALTADYIASHGNYQLFAVPPDWPFDQDYPGKPGDVIAKTASDELASFVDVAHRTAPSAGTFMMQRVLKERYPLVWEKYFRKFINKDPAVDPKAATISESATFQGPFNYLAPDLDGMMERSLTEWNGGPQGNTVRAPVGFWVGLPPSTIEKFKDRPLELRKLPLTDENIGKYRLKALTIDGVGPTPENVVKAVETSDGLSTTDATLPSLNGGYPFSYIAKFIVRTDGMTVTKANATAQLIRYVVGKGQELTVQTNDPVLPPFHKLKALKGANEIIKAVCPSAARIVSKGSTSVYGEEVSFDECGPTPPAATTTTTVAATTTTTTVAATTSSSRSTTSTTQAQVLNNNTNRTSATNPKVTTTKATPVPTTQVAAPTTVATTVPAAVTAATTKPKTTAATEPEPAGPLVQPVDRPGRRRSSALPLILSAIAFRFGGRIAKKRADGEQG